MTGHTSVDTVDNTYCATLANEFLHDDKRAVAVGLGVAGVREGLLVLPGKVLSYVTTRRGLAPPHYTPLCPPVWCSWHSCFNEHISAK